MLILDDQLEVKSVILFRDHTAAGTFHYLPGLPQVVIEDGQVRAQLIRFRAMDKMGGFLSLEMELDLDPALLSSIRDELASRFGVEPNLVPVLFDRGSVRLAALDFDAEGRFAEKLLGTSVPSLQGKQRAIFELTLSAEGSTLIESALRTGSAPILSVYDLEFSGLRPARGFRATVQYRMAYEYLRTRFAMDSLYFRGDLDREAEALSQQGLIKIEDVDYQGVDAAVLAQRESEARSTLSQLMQGLFFRPGASPASAPAGGLSKAPAADAYWAAQGRPAAAFLIRTMDQQEEDVLVYDLSETRVATRNVAPQGALRLPAGTDTSNVILDSTLDWPPPIVLVRAFTLPEADWSGVSTIEIDLRQKERVETIVLSPAQRDQSVNLTEGPIEFNVRVKTSKEPEALGTIPILDPAFRPLTTSNLFFDPVALSGRRELRVTVGAIDFTTVSKVSGVLSAGDEQRSFQLDAATPQVIVPIWGSTSLNLHADLALVDGDRMSVDRTVLATEPVVVINQPAGQFHVVMVMLQDPIQRFSSVSVTLEAAEGARRQNLTLDSTGPVMNWSARRAADSPGSYRYKVRKVLKDSTVIDGNWTEATGSLLVVGDLDIRLETVQGFLLGAATTMGVLVRLTSLNPPDGVDGVQETMLDPDQTVFTANLPFTRSAPLRYTVSAQVFLESEVLEIPLREEASEVLLLSIAKSEKA